MVNFLVLQVIATLFWCTFGAAAPPPVPASAGYIPCAILPLSNNSQHASLEGVQLGAASLWGHEVQGGPRKWEDLYVTGLTVIPYCFPTPEHRAANVNRVESAIKMWMTALGGRYSKANGHKILFHEWTEYSTWFSSYQPIFCININSKVDGTWNMKIPYKTLAIWKDESEGLDSASATVGMGQIPGQPWALGLWMSSEAGVTTIAHELGHVMGMMHEHQRADRNDYVRYDCMQLDDFWPTVTRARADNPDITIYELCTDPRVAAKYGFSGASYTQSQAYSGNYPWMLNAESSYDSQSIMHNGSFAMGNEECQKGHVYECPLIKYRDSTNHAMGVEMLPHWTKPSAQDSSWVKSTYKWTGCPSCRDEVRADSNAEDPENLVLSEDMMDMLDQAREDYIKKQG